MRVPLYQIDAFADGPFTGNPAAVCPLTEWLPDATMQAIAAENNLSETAFFVPQREGYLLRWFTPTVEVELCGHATLASGYVVTRILAPERRSVTFDTRKAGPLVVTREGDRLAMDFPAGTPGLDRLLPWLDEQVLSEGGRIYLAKDARLAADLVPAMYPRIEAFRKVRAEVDPHGVFVSDQSRRLGL